MGISKSLLLLLVGINWFGLCVNSYAATLQSDEANIHNNYRLLFDEPQIISNGYKAEIEKNLEKKISGKKNSAVLKGKIDFVQNMPIPATSIQQKTIISRRRAGQQEVISILEIAKEQMVELLEDEQIEDIKLVTAEVNSKLKNINEKINQSQWLRTDFMLLDSLFLNEGVGAGNSYQTTLSSSIANHSPLNKNFLATPQGSELYPTDELQDGIFSFILRIPSYIFDLENLFFLSLVVFFGIGFFKGLRFFLNNTW